MNYQNIYNKDYFSGKNSFFYKLGYGNYAKLYFDNLFKPLNPYINTLTTGKVLDVGCAYGFLLQRFPSSFKKFGIDVSEYAITVAKKRLPSETFIALGAEDTLPFPEETFDMVICNDVLEHLMNPANALENIMKVLKKDGILYITTPNMNLIRKKIFHYADKKEHHVSLFSHKDMLNLLQKIGFRIIQHWTFATFTLFFFARFKSSAGTESAYICTK
jgi:2-polyprenyl-3-methyl-5-hydroxy-6-metoxy-1,4-benzoquinol methylase